jgi:hypothetical protein
MKKVSRFYFVRRKIYAVNDGMKTQERERERESGVHDDDCDIKIKINSILVQTPYAMCHTQQRSNLNARLRFFSSNLLLEKR